MRARTLGKRLRMRPAALLTLGALCAPVPIATAATCVDTSREIVYANGMFNTYQDARLSLIALQAALDPVLATGRAGAGPFRYEIAYNQNERAHSQFLQVARQNVGDTFSLFWRYWANRLTPPQWFRDAAVFLARQANDATYLSDPDLQQHVARYGSTIAQGGRVLVVAHSQGNFYANEARVRLARDPEVTLGSYGIEAVATPATMNAAGGPYTTLLDDLIIGAVRAANPLTLPPNTDNPPGTSRDPENHSFVDAYMRPATTSRPQIVNQSTTVLSALQTPRQCP